MSLAGGRGLPAGLLAGALSVALLAQLDAITAMPDYFTGLLDAALLAIIVAIDAPGLRQGLDRFRARTRSPATPEPRLLRRRTRAP